MTSCLPISYNGNNKRTDSSSTTSAGSKGHHNSSRRRRTPTLQQQRRLSLQNGTQQDPPADNTRAKRASSTDDHAATSFSDMFLPPRPRRHGGGRGSRGNPSTPSHHEVPHDQEHQNSPGHQYATIEDLDSEMFPDSVTLSRFFGTKVDGAPAHRGTFALSSRQHNNGNLVDEKVPTSNERRSTTPTPGPSPIRQMHWQDPMMRELSLEELMMSRYHDLKPEESVCLVADARTNVGLSKWEPWTEQLYLECESLYEAYYRTPTPRGRLRLQPEGTSPLSYLEGEQNDGKATPSTPTNNGNAIVHTNDGDLSSWCSQSGWSAIWDDDDHRIGAGFSLQTYDEDDRYTIGVIQAMQRKSVEELAKPKTLDTKQRGDRSQQTAAFPHSASTMEHGMVSAGIQPENREPKSPSEDDATPSTKHKKKPKRRDIIRRMLSGKFTRCEL